MKKGYKRLQIFSAVLILIFFINTFFFHFLSSYRMILFLIVLLPIFHRYFVMEKDHHRYLYDVIFEVFVYLISFFLLYYILGFIVGFAKNQNFMTLYGWKTFIIPISCYGILREILRYNMLCKSEGSKSSTILVVFTFILMDITNSLHYAGLGSKYEILRFVALTFLPTISKNISYSFLSRKVGFKPVILFDLIFSLMTYIMPVLPNPNEYVVSIIYLFVPILFAYRIFQFFDKKEDHYLPSNYDKKRIKGMILPTIIVLVLVYLYSGYFRYYTVAIASGSMEPAIKKGDVVILDQSPKEEYDTGDVIAYWRENKIIVHRIVKKVKLEDSYVFYTKGDSNRKIDDILIEDKIIIGKVKGRIPYIGYPTVWFSEK